ncbi:hypothetical protein GOP47_0024184, partial [Adiantum capillus-veneris]
MTINEKNSMMRQVGAGDGDQTQLPLLPKMMRAILMLRPGQVVSERLGKVSFTHRQIALGPNPTPRRLAVERALQQTGVSTGARAGKRVRAWQAGTRFSRGVHCSAGGGGCAAAPLSPAIATISTRNTGTMRLPEAISLSLSLSLSLSPTQDTICF